MKKEEWQRLCRYAKNKGNYHKLKGAIIHSHNALRISLSLPCLDDWVKHFSMRSVLDWYAHRFDELKNDNEI